MIKYETMTRNIYHRIEVERYEATRTKKQVEDSMQCMLRDSGRCDDLDASCNTFTNDEMIEEKEGMSPETDVPFDRQAFLRLKASRVEQQARLAKL